MGTRNIRATSQGLAQLPAFARSPLSDLSVRRGRAGIKDFHTQGASPDHTNPSSSHGRVSV